MRRQPNAHPRRGLLHTSTFPFACSPTFVTYTIDATLIQVICETVLVLMQLLHAYRHARRLGTALDPMTPLLLTLYLDRFAYFVLVATLRLWSALTVRQSFLVSPQLPSAPFGRQLTDEHTSGFTPTFYS
jgi:hypothetical protein